jgi:TDG/mug DNA glycosylase family protein
VIGPGLRVLFCGINPGLYSGAVGHHFARPGNRFWKALHAAGFTRRELSPFEERVLLDDGIGITNLVARATATAAELDDAELRGGARRLARKVRRFRPAFVAFVGIGAYRTAYGRKGAKVGLQRETLGFSRVWLLPNPSGLNANHPLSVLTQAYGELARASGVARRPLRPSGALPREPAPSRRLVRAR